MPICILVDIKKIHYAWRELKLKESTLKRLTKQTPRDMQPSELRCADSSKTTDRPSPSITVRPASVVVCRSDGVVSVPTSAGEPSSVPCDECLPNVWSKRLSFLVARGVPKLNATSWLPIFEMRYALVRLCWLRPSWWKSSYECRR